MKKVYVIYNPISGKGLSCKKAVAISEYFLNSSYDVELIQTQSGSPQQWLEPRLAGSPEALIVIGGDGTLRQVASVAKKTPVALYHVAGGTENLFAHSMGMSNSPARVFDCVSSNAQRLIDSATANSQFMLLMTSVGFDAQVAADLAKNRGGSITHLSYVMPIIRQIFNWNVPVISIDVDGKKIIEGEKGWCIVANSKAYACGLNPARNALIDDGKLDVLFLPITGRLSLLKWIRLMKLGTHMHHPCAVSTTGSSIVVRTSELMPWQIDGDVAEDTQDMTVCCVPESIRVFDA